MRLRELRDRHPGEVRLVQRAFVLVPDEGRHPIFTAYHVQHREAAARLTGLPFGLPEVGSPYPTSSWPALVAALWVRQEHPERFDAFDLALFEAFFRDTRDISNGEVLAQLARDHGLPEQRLSVALRAPSLRRAVMDEHRSAWEYDVSAIPSIVVDGEAVTGAVPLEQYEEALVG